MGTIKVGTSGWSHDDWVGTFYPAGMKRSELLRYYFASFDTLEINSTYHSTPDREEIEVWIDAARSRDNGDISIKLPAVASRDAAMKEDPAELLEILHDFGTRVLEPLDDSGVLGGVLFQASPSFFVRGDTTYPSKREHKVPVPKYIYGEGRLRELLEVLRSLPGKPALELRNSSWIAEDISLVDEGRKVLREHGAALVVVDAPSFPWIVDHLSDQFYVRFHGRNRSAWYRDLDGTSSGKYEYRYTTMELKERVVSIRKMAALGDVNVIFNNHPGGSAPLNALEMKELLGTYDG
ncbi:MAG: DUF72 domain-containing protein [Thermoplasmata archaeon]|nr:DUF72 domain-containing protein [Thermoplasmata archaeon]